MNRTNLRIAYYSVVVAANVILIAKLALENRRMGQLEREEIERNKHLDLQAIQDAHDTMIARINNGEIRSLKQLQEESENEYKFAKIAIREEN